MRTRASDLIGKKFTRLVVLEKVETLKERNKNENQMFNVLHKGIA